MSKHTPGPWVAFPYTEPANSATGRRMGWHINQAGGPGYVTTMHLASHRAIEDEANANLIAAAPDLLRELEHLVRLLEPAISDGRVSVPGLATLNAARAAIAKASA